MKVAGKDYRTIWIEADDSVKIIDQRYLPHRFEVIRISSVDDMAHAIKEMKIRGAGAIGAAAGFGVYLAAKEARDEEHFEILCNKLLATRPTAVNLSWAVERQKKQITGAPDKVAQAKAEAQAIADFDADSCRRIGEHGLKIIEEIAAQKQETINILTHCNAGWLAFVDYGSALSPVYLAHKAGIDIHVWVDETRPRNQGARLTAWELEQQGVPYTVIADNVGGHLMQHGLVDMVITGSDRTTITGDVCNKIGTYLKALAAFDNNIPFYAAMPSSTIDRTLEDGVRSIPIEQRSGEEVRLIQGLHRGEITRVLLTPQKASAINYGFDVTPARLVKGIITEDGIFSPHKLSTFYK